MFVVVTALLDDEEKQEENEGVMLSLESENLMDGTLCSVSIGVSLMAALEGVLPMMGIGAMGGGTERTCMS
eukprot:14498815-Ditylum_brightwellii.AAC.1